MYPNSVAGSLRSCRAVQTPSEVNREEAKLGDVAMTTTLNTAAEDSATAAPAAAVQQAVDPDLVAKIVRQVNFYFSDTNLPTDNFLLKEVKKTPEGWVPVRLLASFKRMKTLTKDIKIIVSALETSPELVVNGHRVRRKLPLPAVDEAEVLTRTVIAENLPEHATIDSLTGKFSIAGQVKMVRICQPNSNARSTAQTVPGADLAVSRQQHALIEFAAQNEAAVAVKMLTDNDNWRSGLKVRPLLRRALIPQQQQQAKPHSSRQQSQHQQAGKQDPSQHQQAQKAQKSPEGANCAQQEPSDQHNGEQDSSRALQAHDASVKQAEALRPQTSSPSLDSNTQSNDNVGQDAETKGGKAAGKGQKSRRTKKDYAAWAGATAETRAIATAHQQSNPDAAEASEPAHGGMKGLVSAPGSSQPKMPDGSRGFSMGRGRGISATASIS